jgi:arabinose-5-phosphate isomerase
MSGNPIRISEQSLAADALRLMQECQITVLPVVNADSTVCGIIHLHDLIRAGLA